MWQIRIPLQVDDAMFPLISSRLLRLTTLVDVVALYGSRIPRHLRSMLEKTAYSMRQV